jgi:hypothetical protein
MGPHTLFPILLDGEVHGTVSQEISYAVRK